MESQENFSAPQEKQKNKAAELMGPEELLETANHLLRLQRQGLGDRTVDEMIDEITQEIELRKAKGQKLQWNRE